MHTMISPKTFWCCTQCRLDSDAKKIGLEECSLVSIILFSESDKMKTNLQRSLLLKEKKRIESHINCSVNLLSHCTVILTRKLQYRGLYSEEFGSVTSRPSASHFSLFLSLSWFMQKHLLNDQPSGLRQFWKWLARDWFNRCGEGQLWTPLCEL